MEKAYDIFEKLPEGPMWVETVIGLYQSKQRLVNLHKDKSGAYFAYDSQEALIVAEFPRETA